MFSKDELTRYQRQLLIDNWGEEGQEKLQNSHVFVAGAGGLGSPVAMYLAAAGVGSITICDYDTVDASNLNRQIVHNEKRIGLNKADSAYATLSSLNHHVKIYIQKSRITPGNVKKLTGNSDIIIDCLDNFTARHLLNRVSVASGIPMIHGGISGFSGQLALLVPPETACLACFLPEKDEPGTIPVHGATAGVIGSMQAAEALKYILNIDSPIKGRVLFWDGIGMSFNSLQLRKKKKCGICGN